MKVFYLITGSGSLLAITSYPDINSPDLQEKLSHKGMTKFLAYEISVEQAKGWYGHHFDVIARDLHQKDDLRILDYNGNRVFERLDFEKIGSPSLHDMTAYESGGQDRERHRPSFGSSTPR